MCDIFNHSGPCNITATHTTIHPAFLLSLVTLVMLDPVVYFGRSNEKLFSRPRLPLNPVKGHSVILWTRLAVGICLMPGLTLTE